MVVASLTIGGVVGILLSGGFIWWEVGRYAAPQVPVTVFDERKLLAAYTVGLFVGVPIAAAYVLLVASLSNGALVGGALFLVAVVVGTEVAQRLVERSAYWGASAAVPFYSVSLRAGMGGILAIAAVAAYLGGALTPTAVGVGTALLTAMALLALEVAGGLLSHRPRDRPSPRVGGPLAGALFGAIAFFLLGIGPTAGPTGAVAAPVVVLFGATLTFRGGRRTLAEVPPPTGPPPLPSGAAPRPYGRTGALPSTEPGPPARP